MDPSSIYNILFIDIETVAQTADFHELPAALQQHWVKKAGYLNSDPEIDAATLYAERAGIYAEFGKVIVIAVGIFTREEEQEHFRLKAFAGHDEKQVLQEFADMLQNKFSSSNTWLCGHNGKEFDFPYLCRRMLVHQIPLPPQLNVMGKKPWETSYLDTMEMWKFGDRKNFTSLDLLATLLELPTSKSDIDGSQVNEVYYREGDLDRIAQYCMRDVLLTARIYQRLNNWPVISDEQVVFV